MKLSTRICLNPQTKYKWAILFKDADALLEWEKHLTHPYYSIPANTAMVRLKFDRISVYNMSGIFLETQGGVTYAYRRYTTPRKHNDFEYTIWLVYGDAFTRVE